MALLRRRAAAQQDVLSRQAATPCIGGQDRPSFGLDELEGERPLAAGDHRPFTGKQGADQRPVDPRHGVRGTDVEATPV